MHHHELEAVRQLARQLLCARARESDPQTISESVLLSGARMVGQQFVLGGVKIHWLAGPQQLRIYEEGQAPYTIDLTQPPTAQKAA